MNEENICWSNFTDVFYGRMLQPRERGGDSVESFRAGARIPFERGDLESAVNVENEVSRIIRGIGVFVDADRDRELAAFGKTSSEEDFDLAMSWDVDGLRLSAPGYI